MSISKRAERGVNLENILLDSFSTYLSNPYDEAKNPNGIINMGTSENKLSMDILHEKLSKIKMADFPTSGHHYGDMRGTAEFRKLLATFLDRYMKPNKAINPDDLYVFNGCGSVLEMLAFAFCEDGEGVLVPAPYYGAFKTDLMCRMGCIAYSVDLSNTPCEEYGETTPFELSVPRLEQALKEATSKGIRIRGIILCNPNNPLGNIYSEKQLTDYLKFADRHRLHVILDEIYMLSVFRPGAKMINGLSLDGIIDPNLLHVVWGFSKDFGTSGFRCGLVHTVNTEVGSVLSSNAYFQSIPTVAQYIIQSLVSDFEWLDKVYFRNNLMRLWDNYKLVRDDLKEFGIEVLEASAGLYVWVDLRNYCHPSSREGEMKLLSVFLENGIYITPGVAFSSPEFGWFRIIISALPHHVKVGIERVKKVLENMKKERENSGDLDGLVTQLQKQIRESNWLEENSVEKWVKENPKLAQEFNEVKQ